MLTDVHLEPDDRQLDEIVTRVKAVAGRGKRVTDADLYEIATTAMGVVSNGKTIDLQEIAVITGNHVIPTASLKATVNGIEHVYASVGVGPVDAALKAIMGILPTKVVLKEFKIEAISGGSDAIGHVVVALEDEKGHIFDASGTGDDIVIASVEAMVNAINLLHRVRKG
jgi:2-isopropylmalate synthase